MELLAVFLLIVVSISLSRRCWWVWCFVPAHKNEKTTNIINIKPWCWCPFKTKQGYKIPIIIVRYWHHRIMRRHVQNLVFIGNIINGKKQKKDFWTCWCGFVFSWEPEE